MLLISFKTISGKENGPLIDYCDDILKKTGVALLPGLDFGLLVGTLTGFLAFIPFFGILIGIFSGLTIAYFQFGTADMMLITASIFTK